MRYGWRLMPSQVSSEPRSSRSRVVPPASGSYFSGIAESREFRIARTAFGSSPIFNAMGGFLLPLHNGDLYITGGFGPVRVSRTE